MHLSNCRPADMKVLGRINTPETSMGLRTPKTFTRLHSMLLLAVSLMHSLAAPENSDVIRRETEMMDETIGHLMQYNSFSCVQEMSEKDLFRAGGWIETEMDGKKRLFLDVYKLSPEELYLHNLPQTGIIYSSVSIVCDYDFQRPFSEAAPRISSVLLNLKILHYCLLNLDKMDFGALWLSKNETPKELYNKKEMQAVHNYMSCVTRSPKLITWSVGVCVTEKHGYFWTPLLFEMLLRTCWFMDISSLTVKVSKYSTRTSLNIPRLLPEGCTVSEMLICVGEHENPEEFEHLGPKPTQENKAYWHLLERIEQFNKYQNNSSFFRLCRPAKCPALPARTDSSAVFALGSPSPAGELGGANLIFISPAPFTVKALKISLEYAYLHLKIIGEQGILWVPEWIYEQVVEFLGIPILLLEMASKFLLARAKSKRIVVEAYDPKDMKTLCSTDFKPSSLPPHYVNQTVKNFGVQRNIRIGSKNVKKFEGVISNLMSWIIANFPMVEKISIAYTCSRQHPFLQNMRALPSAQCMGFAAPGLFPERLQTVEVDYRQYLCNGYVPIVIDSGMYKDYKIGVLKGCIEKNTDKEFLDQHPYILQTLTYNAPPGCPEEICPFFYCPHCGHLIIPRGVVYIPAIIPSSVLPMKYAKIFLSPCGHSLCTDCIEALRLEPTRICCLSFYTTYIYDSSAEIRNKSLYYEVVYRLKKDDVPEYYLVRDRVLSQKVWIVDGREHASGDPWEETLGYESDDEKETGVSCSALAGSIPGKSSSE